MCKHTGDVNAMGVGREQHGVVQATIYITVGTVIDGQEYRPFHRSKFRSMHSTRHCPIRNRTVGALSRFPNKFSKVRALPSYLGTCRYGSSTVPISLVEAGLD